MTYFADLSPYVYQDQGGPMVNIGWLGAGHEFTTGVVAEDVIEALVLLAADQHNIMRGLHDCEFCDAESPIRVPASNPRGFVSLGMGELHTVGDDGTVYAAPSLVLHYITRHSYQPPAEFVDAVHSGRSCPGHHEE